MLRYAGSIYDSTLAYHSIQEHAVSLSFARADSEKLFGDKKHIPGYLWGAVPGSKGAPRG